MPKGVFIRTPEYRANMSAAKTGQPSPNRGIPWTPRQRARFAETRRAPIGTIGPRHLGYVTIKSAQPNTWELEHRAVFEKVFGFMPEVVHHIDGNRANNTLENLEGMTKAEHTRLHRSR